MDAQSKTVILVENNAGRLFAGIPGGNWYDVTLGKPGSFADDAQCIAGGETDDWNLDIYDDQPEGDEVATWENGTTQLPLMSWGDFAAKSAARSYLGILTEDMVTGFAHKHLDDDGHVVEVGPVDSDGSAYYVQRHIYGVEQWETVVATPGDVVEEAKELGLAGWFAGLECI